MRNNSESPEKTQIITPRDFGIWERRWYNALLGILSLEKVKSSPIQQGDREDTSVEWKGEYFRVHCIDETTYAIGEQNDQSNHSYIILGDKIGILFDAGVQSGVQEIAQDIAKTHGVELKIMFSHLHYDHLGDSQRIDAMMPRLPQIEAKADGFGLIRKATIDQLEYLGIKEKRSAPDIQVTDWIDIGSEIDIGGRKLQTVYAPGHCYSHVILWDKSRNQIFAADLMGTAPIYAMVPTSSVGDYIWTVNNLLSIVDGATKIYSTHRGNHAGLPIQGRQDLIDFQELLMRADIGDIPDKKIYDGPFQLYKSENNPGVSLVTPWELPWISDYGKRILNQIPSGIK